jgi:putative nucleotidyltransferase with HDIG domain
MRELPLSARVFILLLFGLSLAAAVISLVAVAADSRAFLIVAVLAITIVALDAYPVRLFSVQKNNVVEITISVAVKMAAVLLLPPPVVILAVFFGTLVAEWVLQRVWYKLIFNIGMLTLNTAAAVMVYSVIHNPTVELLGSPQNILALVALGLSDIAINSILVSTVVALASKTSVIYVWAQNCRPVILHDLSMLPIGIFIYILWQYAPLSVLLAGIPLFVLRYSYQLVADLRQQTRDALYALARVLDERDQLTSRHSDLVAEHAGLMAQVMGLGPEQVEVIMLAAAMHDIGKLGMRNDILFKPGALTLEERELAKRHPVIGAELLKKFPLFEKGAVYVRHHHERWDATGYPDGLGGEDIPLGARILAVADSYQAMVEQRPYREPLSQEAAMEQLRQGAGSQFDPHVVSVFLNAKEKEDPTRREQTTYLSQKIISV